MKPQILRDLRFLFSLVVACGPTGVSGAAWGRAAPWAAARPSDGVACGAAGVPGAGGPGRCVCRWAAARPRAVRAASFARRVGSKPGQAPPPPTGTAAWPSGPSGALHTGGSALLMCGSTRRLEAWPGPAAAARPSGPPMWSGLSCWDFGALRCVLLQTSSIGGVFRVDF